VLVRIEGLAEINKVCGGGAGTLPLHGLDLGPWFFLEAGVLLLEIDLPVNGERGREPPSTVSAGKGPTTHQRSIRRLGRAP